MPFNGLSPAPKLERAPFGLETVADVVEHTEADGNWATGYQQENALCHYKGTTWSPCTTAAQSDLYEQDGDVWKPVRPFFIQAEDTCRGTLAVRRPETRDRLLALLDSLSWKGLERELWYGDHAQADADNDTPYLDMAGAISVGTGLSPVRALASLLERMAAVSPGTQGVVHMSPGAAVTLTSVGVMEAVGDVMRVKATGTPVVVGTGYADPDGLQDTIYGTGPITAHVGPSKIITADLTQGANIAQNEFTVVAERPVAVAWDGCVHISAGITYA